jgi:hypothetical protein
MSRDESITNDEWENRQLCSDGNCIGVIGPDGLCKECGRPGEGGPVPKAADDTLSREPEDTGDSDHSSPEDQESTGEAEETANDADDWANRRLCPDGNCIGVIGPDGKCKECGRPGE